MKEKITTYQLLTMMILMPYSTAVLFYIAPETHRAIWIALIFYAFISIIIQAIYLSLYYKYPNNSIIMYMPKVYGKYIGFILNMIYILYFYYSATRNLRDFSELISMSALPNMSIFSIGSFFMIIITYGVYKGIENIGSIIQFSFILFIIIKFTIILLLIVNNNILDYTRLLPIFNENPLKTILSGWKLIAFPYGEFIAFTMLYPFVLQQNKLRKTIFFATFLEALLLIINNIVLLLALGYKFATSSNFPLLETYKLIYIGTFLNRLELLLLVVMIWNGFFKIVIWMYCGALGICQTFKIKNWGLLCTISGILVLIGSLFIAKNYPQHIKLGLDTIPKYIHLPIQILIPLLTLFIYYIKKWFLNK